MRDKLLVMIPELLEADNDVFSLPEIPTHIMAERTVRIVNPRQGG